LRHSISFRSAAAAALLWAASPTAAAAALSYDCDTASGSFSELKQSQAGPSYRVSGRITARQLRVDKRWLPAGNVAIASADQKVFVMLKLSGLKRPKGPLEVILVNVDGGRKTQQVLGQIGLNETLSFTLSVQGSTARAEIGRMGGDTVAAIGPGGSVGITCSTGDFMFDDLKLDSAGPPVG
jgi:hypothetical protein